MQTLNKEAIKELLSQRFANDVHKSLSELPRPSILKDSIKAAKRIKMAIERDEKIAIVGDYDVDGIVACVIMAEFLDELGANYVVKIPNRFKDGYGINEDIVKALNTTLIITVDNGIAAFEAAALCEERGIDLIITDHHQPQSTLPKAYAIINPKQEDDEFPNIEICGAQVAWYLLASVKEVCKLNINMSEFIELLAIAIMGDMMELRDLNRLLIRKGLERINASKRPAFRALKLFYQKEKFDFDSIGFLIAPLINSTGRMDDARLSFEFLYSKNLNEAQGLLEQIVSFNNKRKSEEKRLFDESLKMISEDDFALVVGGKDWHEGVLGIVASRLARHFNKPAFVFSEKDDKAKGSGRSVGKINILELIEAHKELFLAYGGHKGASGMLIETSNFNALKTALNETCKQVPKEDFLNKDELLGILPLSELDFKLLALLEFFEPFGHKNPRPLFKFENLLVKNVRKIGKDERHLKLILADKNSSIEALFFNFNTEVRAGDTISCTANVGKNDFGGVITPQLIIKSLSFS